MSGAVGQAVFEIPLSAAPQRFSITLVGVTYIMRVAYHDTAEGGWSFDLSDISGQLMIAGAPLVTGADLLGQYAYLEIGGQLRVTTDGDPDAVPTFENLGTVAHLYFIPDGETS